MTLASRTRFRRIMKDLMIRGKIIRQTLDTTNNCPALIRTVWIFMPIQTYFAQASIFCPDTASMKEIQTPYEVFKNTTSQRISVGGADAHSRILSRSSEGCMYDPTPSYVNTPSEPLQHLEHSQHYISDCNRLNSDDTSSTSSGTGDR
jgi:hypothetical protein